jgi:hypothetical protein
MNRKLAVDLAIHLNPGAKASVLMKEANTIMKDNGADVLEWFSGADQIMTVFREFLMDRSEEEKALVAVALSLENSYLCLVQTGLFSYKRTPQEDQQIKNTYKALEVLGKESIFRNALDEKDKEELDTLLKQ